MVNLKEDPITTGPTSDTMLLDRLLMFFELSRHDRKKQEPGLQFQFKEGITIGDVDPYLEIALLKRLERRTKEPGAA